MEVPERPQFPADDELAGDAVDAASACDDTIVVVDWAQLPAEVLVCVFSSLQRRELYACLFVCRRWCATAYMERTWAELVRRDVWPDLRRKPAECTLTYREIALSHASAIDRNWRNGAFRTQILPGQLEGKGVIDCLRHGDLVIAAGLSKSISVTSLHTNETQHFPAHDHFVCSLEMAAPNVMAAASYDARISLWDVSAAAVSKLSILSGHTSFVLETKAFGAGQLLSRSRDSTLRLWDLDKGVCKSVLRGHARSVTAMKRIDHNCVVSCSRDGGVVLFDVRSKAGPVRQIDTPHACDVYALHALDGNVVASCSADSHLALWDFAQGRTIRHRTPEVAYCLKSDAQHQTLFAGGSEGSLLVKRDLFNTDVPVFANKRASDWVMSSMRVVGSRVVCGSLDHSVTLWSPTDGGAYAVERSLTDLHTGMVRKVRASHFSIMSAGYDGRVVLCSFVGGGARREADAGSSAFSKCTVC